MMCLVFLRFALVFSAEYVTEIEGPVDYDAESGAALLLLPLTSECNYAKDALFLTNVAGMAYTPRTCVMAALPHAGIWNV